MTPLEAVPDSEKDWHAGSNGLVLDLVHPSLYPIVFGRTMGKVSGSETATILEPPQLEDTNPKFVSKRFQWLPSDYSVDADGKVTLASPYINNIHPIRHRELYSVIPEILQCAVPMFERVLSDLLRPLLPMRVATSAGHRSSVEGVIDCIWQNGVPHPDSESEDEFDDNPDAWYTKHEFSTPDARKKYGGDLGAMADQVSLKGRTLQVIVRLANIVLTPERPEYPGGRWHVEGLLWSGSHRWVNAEPANPQGMRNEMIVSSFIYVSSNNPRALRVLTASQYYDSENISESKLSFRRATSEPQTHGRDDPMCSKVLYGIDWCDIRSCLLPSLAN